MRKLILLLILFLSAFTLLSLSGVGADEYTDKQKQIDELEKKISELKSQAQTLSGQIVYYDGQIALNTLKISQTEDTISSLTGKINSLESNLQKRSEELERQIVMTYKQGQVQSLDVLFSSRDVSHVIAKFKYAQLLQNHNRKFLYETQKVQSNYALQKDLVEDAKVKLEQQKNTLANLRKEKDNLLAQTKNNEATYQRQLEQAKLELLAIQAALASAKKEGPVKAGDPIALVGNSGYPSCSTGKHLHFEVRKDDTWVNAEAYLKSQTDVNGVQIGSGGWNWPIEGKIQITQRYGKTPWSYRYVYSGGIHTGIDMISDNDVIRAPADGDLYYSKSKCGSSDLNVKYIDHGNGLKTFYLHVQ